MNPKISQARKFINKIYAGDLKAQKIMKEYNLSPGDIYSAEILLQDFENGATDVETILSGDARFFEYLGFKVLGPGFWSIAYKIYA